MSDPTMKLSRVDDARSLRADIKQLRKMQEAVSTYPREQGYLHIGNEYIKLPMPRVDALLMEHEEHLSNRACELGVEVDE